MPRWVHPAWKVLGIDPTSDARAIRTAYSAKLKAIDPETDPKAFIELREAFEAARVQAQWVDQEDEEDTDEDDYPWDEDEEGESWTPAGDLYQIRPSGHVPDPDGGPPDPAWESPAPPEAPGPAAAPAEPARASPWTTVSTAEADAHSRELATLLYSHDRQAEPWPTPAQEDAMLAHWRAIVADPRMQEVSYFADAERWFSELIARTSAFSDPLVIPVTDYFGWLGSDGTITQTAAIAHVTRRYRMLEFQRAVKQPGHPLNPAWRELVRPLGKRAKRGGVNGRKVRQLLRIVRSHYPDLEGCFDLERVALWDGTHIGTGGGGGGGSSWNWIGPALFLGFFLFRVLANFGGSSTTPPMPIPIAAPLLTNPATDIDRALDRVFGEGKLDLATIGKRNPKLHQELINYWKEEQPRLVTQDGFADDLEIYLTRWYADGVWRGDAALLADHHRLVIDMAKALQTNPAACRRFLENGRLWSDRLSLPASFHEQQKALMIRAALETDGSEAHEGGEFSIPGDVVDAAAARAHMNREALSAAMLFKGSDANQCVGRIAFMETVLALPRKQGLPIMRHM